MHIVCKYSSVKDLCRVTKVCKSWCYATFYETRRRCYFQQLRLPYKIGNLASQLEVKPSVSLLFYDLSIEQSLSLSPTDSMKTKGLLEELLKDFRTQLPNGNKTIVVTTHECLTTNEAEFEGNKKNSDILGLFLPIIKRKVQVHVAWNRLYDLLEETLEPDYFAKKLG